VVRVGLDSLDGAPADLVERRLAHLRGGVAGQELLAYAVLADGPALAWICRFGCEEDLRTAP